MNVLFPAKLKGDCLKRLDEAIKKLMDPASTTQVEYLPRYMYILKNRSISLY
jgi:hypothetical protein